MLWQVSGGLGRGVNVTALDEVLFCFANLGVLFWLPAMSL